MPASINEPVKAAFEAFVWESELINANTTSTINSLKMKIPNQIFQEWANILIQCQSDRSMKNTLPTIVQKFSDVRIVQSELEAMMQGPKREAITMMFLVIANVPLLYFLNRDWFHTLILTRAPPDTLGPKRNWRIGRLPEECTAKCTSPADAILSQKEETKWITTRPTIMQNSSSLCSRQW